MQNINAGLFIGGFIAYMALMICIGIFASRSKSKGKNYLTGGSALPVFLIFATMSATMIGTGSSIGATANGFRYGWYGSAYGLGAALGIAALVYISNRAKLRAKGFITMSEDAQYHYNGNMHMKTIMSFMILLIEVVWLGNHINGGATYLAYITGLDPIMARLVTALSFGLYVIIGGYLAVVWTDFVQLMILLAGFVVIVIVAIPAAGGWDTIQATMEAAGKGGNLTFYGIGAMGVMGVVSLIYTIFIPCFGTPTYRMRIYTSKDDKSANRALLRSSGLLLVFSMFPAIIGMAAFTIATNTGADGVVANPDYAFAYVATIVLGPVLGLFFMIAGLSATMSSGDSDAIAGVTILIQDIYPKVTGKELPDDKVGTWSRIGVVLMLTMAFCATLFAKDVMGYISNVIGSIIPGVSVAMILGVMWKRVTWQGGLASIFSGLIFGVLFLAVASFREAIVGAFTGPAIPASLVALAFAVVVSLCTHNEQLSEDERMRLVIEGRGKKA